MFRFRYRRLKRVFVKKLIVVVVVIIYKNVEGEILFNKGN